MFDKGVYKPLPALFLFAFVLVFVWVLNWKYDAMEGCCLLCVVGDDADTDTDTDERDECDERANEDDEAAVRLRGVYAQVSLWNKGIKHSNGKYNPNCNMLLSSKLKCDATMFRMRRKQELSYGMCIMCVIKERTLISLRFNDLHFFDLPLLPLWVLCSLLLSLSVFVGRLCGADLYSMSWSSVVLWLLSQAQNPSMERMWSRCLLVSSG